MRHRTALPVTLGTQRLLHPDSRLLLLFSRLSSEGFQPSSACSYNQTAITRATRATFIGLMHSSFGCSERDSEATIMRPLRHSTVVTPGRRDNGVDRLLIIRTRHDRNAPLFRLGHEPVGVLLDVLNPVLILVVSFTDKDTHYPVESSTQHNGCDGSSSPFIVTASPIPMNSFSYAHPSRTLPRRMTTMVSCQRRS